MQKTIEQLQAALDREMKYSDKLNKRIDRLRDQLKNCITKEEHDRIIAYLQRKHELELAEIKNQQCRKRNERGAGRKRKATKQVILRVLELRKEGFSQEKISKTIFEELHILISRTTVGEIVRGEHGSGTE
jgi:hypothetical protein